jgi:hypothetical protein
VEAQSARWGDRRRTAEPVPSSFRDRFDHHRLDKADTLSQSRVPYTMFHRVTDDGIAELRSYLSPTVLVNEIRRLTQKPVVPDS